LPKVTDSFGKPSAGQLPGLVEAIVVDNVDPEKLGRVKLKFPMLPDTPESYWARLMSPMAGKERGLVTLPEIGDEVLVTFMQGSFENAIVLGAVFNGEDEPPYANDDGDNNLRVFQSRSGHRLTFDDKDGEERIELVTHNDEIRFIYDSKEKTLSIYSGKDIIIEAKESFELKCKDFILEAEKTISVESKTTDITGNAATNIIGGGQLILTAGQMLIN
jgi:uncharacterized protein involved in type VI secretion and phage assembly